MSIDRAIWLLAKLPDEVGACVTAQFGGIHPRLRALIALAQLKGVPQPNINELNKFYNESSSLVLKRNRAVHDAWWISSPSGTVAQLRLVADKKLDYRFKPASMADMEALAEEIKEHDIRFFRIEQQMFAALHLASLEKPAAEPPRDTPD